jgi:hypothetical protein
MIKVHAEQYGIWEYIDPDVNENDIKKLAEPQEPTLSMVRTDIADPQISDLDPDQREQLKFLERAYDRKNAKYITLKKGHSAILKPNNPP